MTEHIQDRVRRIISEVFGISVDQINDESSPDTIESWDSEGHINLILSLEAEFGISLSPEDAMEMLSIRLVRLILAERGVPSAP